MSSGTEDDVKNLQQLLEKEREKAQILETQLKSGASSIPRPMLSENERARLKEIEVLKSQVCTRNSYLLDTYNHFQWLWTIALRNEME